MIETISVGKILFDIAIWAMLLFLSLKQIFNYRARGVNYLTLLFFLLIYSTFAFCTGDYLNYKALYIDIVKYNSNIHLETIYYWLIKILPQNYHVWRTVVWGLASFVLIFTFKRLKLPQEFTVMIFVILLMPNFPNLRNALGYVVLLLAMSYVTSPIPHRKVYSIIVAVILFVCSLFLHKSMFVYLALAICAFLPLNKSFYVFAIILFPFLYSNIYDLALQFIDILATGDIARETGQGYIESDFRAHSNIWGLIQLSINRLPTLILLLCIIYNGVFKNSMNVATQVKVYMRYTFMLFYLSFLFFGQDVSSYLSPRFWDAGMFPATLVVADYFGRTRRKPLFIACMLLLILANCYNFAYAVYKV